MNKFRNVFAKQPRKTVYNVKHIYYEHFNNVEVDNITRLFYS